MEVSMAIRREQLLRGYPCATRSIPLMRYVVVVYGFSIGQGKKNRQLFEIEADLSAVVRCRRFEKIKRH